MSSPDFHSVVEDLKSDQIDKQMNALKTASEIVEILAEEAVAALKRSHDRLFIAERLSPLGSAAVLPLERLIKESDDSDVHILASLVLLQLGSAAGVPLLLDALQKDNTYPCLIARHLVRAPLDGIGDRIVSRLQSCELEDIDLILCLLDLVEKLDYPLPSVLYQRFTTDDAPIQIREAVIDSAKG